MFPTSRCLSVDQGKGMTDQGVLPDIEIPWTPSHFVEMWIWTSVWS